MFEEMPVSETESKSLATCMTSRANPTLEEWNGRTNCHTGHSALGSASPARPMLSSPSIGRQGRHAGVAAHVFSPCALAGRGNWRWRASVSAASSRSRRQAPFINSTRPNPTSPRFRIHQLLHAASRSLTPSLPVPVTPPLSPPAGAMGSTGREPEVTRADFPDGFVFGVATSAYQVGTPPPPFPSHPAPPPSLGVCPAECLRLAYA